VKLGSLAVLQMAYSYEVRCIASFTQTVRIRMQMPKKVSLLSAFGDLHMRLVLPLGDCTLRTGSQNHLLRSPSPFYSDDINREKRLPFIMIL
jgi:hypothetical protein